MSRPWLALICLFAVLNGTCRAAEETAQAAAEPVMTEATQEERGRFSNILSNALYPAKRMMSFFRTDDDSEREPDPKTPLIIDDRAHADMRIRSIQYLAGQKAENYPDVVDALLASLDDESEEVRHEALQATQNLCKAYICQSPSSKNGKCRCAGCRADRRVRERLSSLLLETNAEGGLLEDSGRIRVLATRTITLCLKPRTKEPTPRKLRSTSPSPIPVREPNATAVASETQKIPETDGEAPQGSATDQQDAKGGQRQSKHRFFIPWRNK